MILATDLDGTFLGGNEFQKQRLYGLLKRNPLIRLIFVTGRGLESVTTLLQDATIPRPDYIICDVGATVVHGHTLEPVWLLQEDIEARCPDIGNIRERLAGIPGLEYQPVPQQRRCSFFLNDTGSISLIRDRLQGINCELIYSAGKYLDILPGGVNKGSTLVNLVQYLQAEEEEILVAGDTMNDLAMFRCGYKGVVVGKSEASFAALAGALPNVFVAKEEGTGGILECFRHFDQLNCYVESQHGATGNAPALLNAATE